MSKIPQGEWNAIAARYQNGESISQIARGYSCTPPAIHYILKRNRQRPAGISVQPRTSAPPAAHRAPSTNAAGGVDVATLAEGSGIAGRTGAPASTSTPQHAPGPVLRSEELTPAAGRPALVRNRPPEPVANPLPPAPTQGAIAGSAALPVSGLRDTGPAWSGNSAIAPAVLPGLDDALHLRAEAAIALFRSSFDQALVEGSLDVRERLRQAANDLMRVAARTTIVLDRLNGTNERSARAQNYPRSAHAGDDFGKLR